MVPSHFLNDDAHNYIMSDQKDREPELDDFLNQDPCLDSLECMINKSTKELLKIITNLAAGMKWFDQEFIEQPVSMPIIEDMRPLLQSFEISRRYAIENILAPLGVKSDEEIIPKEMKNSNYLSVEVADLDNRYVRFVYFFSEMWRRVAYNTLSSFSMSLFSCSRREITNVQKVNDLERSISRLRESILVSVELIEAAARKHEKPGWVGV